jgi:hypothetical protein
MGCKASVCIFDQEDGDEGLSFFSKHELRIVCDMEEKSLKWELIQTEFSVLAAYVERRFAAHEHHVLATVRSDGRPRVSGTNVMFTNGAMWIGMMPTALRAADLLNSPYCALHSAPLNEKLPRGEGDVRIYAVARELSSDEARELFFAKFPDADDVMPGKFFELLTTDFSIVEVDNEEIVLTRWSAISGVEVTRHQ